jgi:sodium/hydrogen exchanger 8
MLKWATVVGIASLAGTFIVGFMLEQRHVHWLPEAGVGILIGILVSGIAKFFHESHLLQKEKFDFEFFMIWLLPPIIFEVNSFAT